MSGNKVATRWRARGTDQAALGDLPATGESIDIGGVMIDHVVGGRVVERWEQFDQAGMMHQLGVA
jgi:predicted ester cyclase